MDFFLYYNLANKHFDENRCTRKTIINAIATGIVEMPHPTWSKRYRTLQPSSHGGSDLFIQLRLLRTDCLRVDILKIMI